MSLLSSPCDLSHTYNTVVTSYCVFLVQPKSFRNERNHDRHIHLSLHGISHLPAFLTHYTVALPAQELKEVPKAPKDSDMKSLVGPITNGMFADPSVLKAGDTYYVYATNEDGVRCPAATSKNFKDWTVVADNEVLSELPEWAAGGKGESVWGPDVYQNVSHAITFCTLYVH